MLEKWNHFPVYMWAGPGTVRINKVKFPGSEVNERVHLLGGLAEGARKLKEMGYNWAYSTYNWGFPPEIEKEDHEYFRHTVEEYHKEGLKVFGYVQFSNTVFTGSYTQKRWYAMDPFGEKIHYYSGRYLTCPTDPTWKEHLEEMVQGILSAGADGVFFDNAFGSWYGHRPCFCERCQRDFKEFARSAGMDVKGIPEYLADNQESRAYLLWRRKIVWNTIEELARLARSVKPEVWISSNSFEAGVNRLSLISAMDLREAFRVQDVVMIENHQIPRKFIGLQIFNTITYRIAHAHSKGKPVTSVPYAMGIGSDEVYPVKMYLHAMAEAYANDSVMVLKGTEYFHNNEWTLITDDEFEDVRAEIARYHEWFKGEKGVWNKIYGKRATKIAIFHPYDSLIFHWDKTALPFFAAQHELIRHRIDYKVVWDDFRDVDLLIVPPVFEETEMDLLRNYDGDVLYLGFSSTGIGKVVWERDYKSHIFYTSHFESQLAAEQAMSLLAFRNYFDDPRWRTKLDANYFLFTNYMRYSYPFAHPFNPSELVNVVKPYQPWHVQGEGFLIVASYEEGDLLKLHVVNLEDEDVPIKISTPSSWRPVEMFRYEHEGALIHSIHIFQKG